MVVHDDCCAAASQHEENDPIGLFFLCRYGVTLSIVLYFMKSCAKLFCHLCLNKNLNKERKLASYVFSLRFRVCGVFLYFLSSGLQ